MQSLCYQLDNTNVEALELIPTNVATHLMNGGSDPRAVHLWDFIVEGMAIMEPRHDATEILVENVKRLRLAAESGAFEGLLQGFNDAMERNSHCSNNGGLAHGVALHPMALQGVTPPRDARHGLRGGGPGPQIG